MELCDVVASCPLLGWGSLIGGGTATRFCSANLKPDLVVGALRKASHPITWCQQFPSPERGIS